MKVLPHTVGSTFFSDVPASNERDLQSRLGLRLWRRLRESWDLLSTLQYVGDRRRGSRDTLLHRAVPVTPLPTPSVFLDQVRREIYFSFDYVPVRLFKNLGEMEGGRKGGGW